MIQFFSFLQILCLSCIFSIISATSFGFAATGLCYVLSALLCIIVRVLLYVQSVEMQKKKKASLRKSQHFLFEALITCLLPDSQNLSCLCEHTCFQMNNELFSNPIKTGLSITASNVKMTGFIFISKLIQ